MDRVPAPRGRANGLRALGFTLLPAAAWLTGTLEMVVEIAGSVDRLGDQPRLRRPHVGWASAWPGSRSCCWLVSGFIRDRQLARGQAAGAGGRTTRGKDQLPEAAVHPDRPDARARPCDDEMADIEAMLRKRGIE